MKTIWKFNSRITDEIAIQMPEGAETISAQPQGPSPDGMSIWAIVDPDAKSVFRHFRVFGTGHTIPDNLSLKFIATGQYLSGALVFHLFEVLDQVPDSQDSISAELLQLLSALNGATMYPESQTADTYEIDNIVANIPKRAVEEMRRLGLIESINSAKKTYVLSNYGLSAIKEIAK